ncbi:radical SAM protein [Candidatus Bathyarchaeota archaeon]|nr:radical SAM protein [Candidatus Bathyarchaeota archaeon]
MQLSAEAIWRASTKELIDLLNAGALAPKPKAAHFYAPSFMYYKTRYYRSSQNHFPTVSVTGTMCALNCKHCGGKVLETMQPAETPEKLLALAVKLKQNGALGCLVSGGCFPDGSIPLKGFVPAIEKIKRELGLTVFVHTGIIDSDAAIALKNAGVDAALIDIIGSDETIKKLGNLNVTVKDYTNSLSALQEAGLNFVPHVIVGLDEGKLRGELDALKMIASVKPSAVVVIAFMPIPGTAMAKVNSPQPAEIAKVTAMARLMFPRTPLVLGCVRPKGKHRAETDVLALKAGVDAVAFPSEEAIEYAENQGYEFSFSSRCCAQIYVDATFRSSSK